MSRKRPFRLGGLSLLQASQCPLPDGSDPRSTAAFPGLQANTVYPWLPGEKNTGEHLQPRPPWLRSCIGGEAAPSCGQPETVHPAVPSPPLPPFRCSRVERVVQCTHMMNWFQFKKQSSAAAQFDSLAGASPAVEEAQ